MRVVSKFNPEKKFYEYKHRMELHDDFGDEGRLCFDEDMYQIKKYMALFVLNPNTPKTNPRLNFRKNPIIRSNKI